MSNLSISEISEQLARIDGLDEEAKAYLHRQIRNWANHGLIVPVGARGYGRTAAALFDGTALGKCRIFSVLTDLGFDVSRLRQVNQDLRDSLVGIRLGKQTSQPQSRWRLDFERRGGRRYGRNSARGDMGVSDYSCARCERQEACRRSRNLARNPSFADWLGSFRFQNSRERQSKSQRATCATPRGETE